MLASTREGRRIYTEQCDRPVETWIDPYAVAGIYVPPDLFTGVKPSEPEGTLIERLTEPRTK